MAVKKLHDNVCNVCLTSDRLQLPPACHQEKLYLACNVSGINRLLCDKCPSHKKLQDHLKSNFDEKLGFRNLQIFKQTNNNQSDSDNNSDT